MLQAIKFEDNKVLVLDQLKLPLVTEYIELKTTQDAHDAIKRMVVRGAPAIAIVGMLGVAIDVKNQSAKEEEHLANYAVKNLDYIVTARPTAVNLGNAASEMKQLIISNPMTPNLLLDAAIEMLQKDIVTNKQIGAHGKAFVDATILSQDESLQKIGVLTICNTGSLATAGYGTALGIIRSLYSSNCLDRAYALETRPYNQGARLTAFELVHDQIPATLVTDSMASSLFRKHPEIKLVVVGADRVVANGDTANKIGTFQLAVLARHFGVKFVVAAPTTSIDLNTKSGDEIVIEDRPENELTDVNGQRIAAPGIDVWNPSFDVTPYNLIDAIITENGVWNPKV